MRTLALFCVLAFPAAALAQTTPASAPAPALVVHMKDFSYVPKGAKITVGDTIVFINDDDSAHTVTANDATFDSGYMAKDAKWSYTFTKAGTVAYYCIYHKFMRATITVAEK